jgi:hypothetical protein
MNPEVRFDDDRLVAVFEAEIHAHPVRIEVDRNTIEDHLETEERLTPEDCVAFVTRNSRQITEHVAHYLRHAPDVDGMLITADQLRGCR